MWKENDCKALLTQIHCRKSQKGRVTARNAPSQVTCKKGKAKEHLLCDQGLVKIICQKFTLEI